MDRILDVLTSTTLKGVTRVKDILAPVNPPQKPGAVLEPVQVTGFYTVKNDTTLTFYCMTSYPTAFEITNGWTIDGLTGLTGRAQVIKASTQAKTDGEAIYRWSFDFATDTPQSIPAGEHYVTGATLYPPGHVVAPTRDLSGKLQGFYLVHDATPVLFFTSIPPNGFWREWTVSNLPGPVSTGTVSAYVQIGGRVMTGTETSNSYLSSATLAVNSGILVDSATAVFFTDAIATPPVTSTTFAPATVKLNVVTKAPEPDKYDWGGAAAPLRDLNTGLEDVPQSVDEATSKEIKDETLMLHAMGPQEVYMTGTSFDNSYWNPKFPAHTNFAMYQRVIPLPGTTFIGQTVTMEINPAEIGDLMSNMYMQCSLPALTGRYKYTQNIGRALIDQIDFMVNETVIETLYDDWYQIRDQLFLDADEQRSMAGAINGGNTGETQNPGKLIIPLEFFFCRRHSNGKGKHERLRRPYFPVCAVLNQKIYIRIKFHPSVWFTNNPDPVEIIEPSLIIEEVKLTPAERIYTMNNPIRLVINRVKKESTLKFNQNNVKLSLTANFPVQMIAWFIRNNKYESLDRNYYDSRYDYGYTTKYIRSAVPLTFTSGTVNYIDTIETAKITLNNADISSDFQGSLYYSFKQPMEHGLSVPSKNIYMYSFGLSPKEYNQGGYINFSKLNSQTTSLQLKFLPKYTSQLQADYNLNLYYYGYSILEFQGGFARLPFL